MAPPSKEKRQRPPTDARDNSLQSAPTSAPSANAPPLPASLASDSLPRLSSLVQMNLLAALQGMQDLAARAPADEQSTWKKHLQTVQAALRHVHKTCPGEPGGVGAPTAETAIDPAHAARFGALVEQARKLVGMSRAKLAERAGLHEQTVYNVETAANLPSHETIMRLLAVKELGITGDDVPWNDPPPTEGGSAPNCWIAPGYDPIKMFTELFELVNGHGGSLEQTYAYLDHKSAVNWYSLSNQGPFAASFRANMPLQRAAQEIRQSAGRSGLDVIALGAGDGKQEVRLVQHLLATSERGTRTTQPDLRLYLLDISQPLLSAAYQYANEHAGSQGVYVCAVQGNFHNWPQYTQLHFSAERAHRRRVIVMLGNTVGNLDNEARFFRHTLTGLAPGDLLLMDVGMAFGSPDQPEEIQRRDRLLINGFQPAHSEWLTGPLLRYCEGATEVPLRPSLDLHSPIPGSYTVDALATVKLRNGREKRFSVFRFKRYDPALLGEVLRHLGWELLLSIPFGADASPPVAALMLFRKFSASRPG